MKEVIGKLGEYKRILERGNLEYWELVQRGMNKGICCFNLQNFTYEEGNKAEEVFECFKKFISNYYIRHHEVSVKNLLDKYNG